MIVGAEGFSDVVREDLLAPLAGHPKIRPTLIELNALALGRLALR